jgi:hypothetical protein
MTDTDGTDTNGTDTNGSGAAPQLTHAPADRQGAVADALVDFQIDPNYKRWPLLDPDARYEVGQLDIRQELRADLDIDLPDYSGPFRPDLRFTDFSREQLVRMLEMCDEYRHVWVGAWLDEVERYFGRQERLDIEWIAWRDVLAPALPAMLEEFLPDWMFAERLALTDLGRFVGERPAGEADIDVDYALPFAPVPELVERPKEELVTMLLGSHEYILACNQSVAMQVVIRHSLDEMYAISWDIWSAKVLPAVMDLKRRHMRMSGNDVAAFMKDLQIDASAFPGKKFDLVFEMPSPDVGIMTFNRCAAPTMWEALGREDILEKGCHMTCPASIEETAKLYDPNMKMDVLANPPRPSEGSVCCRWQLSMRTPDDPEYVPVDLTTRPD